MLVYYWTFMGFAFLALTVLLGRIRARFAILSHLPPLLRRFFVPFTVTGVVFSGLQIWLQLSDDLEATSHTIHELEVELARLRTVLSFLKPEPWLEVALYICFVTLLIWPAVASHRRTIRVFERYLSVISSGYIWLCLLTSMTFFGALVAEDNGPLAQRIATLERHVDRIDDRYAAIVEQVSLTVGSELFQALVESAHEPDDVWPQVIAFATELNTYLGSIPPSDPGSFDGPDSGTSPTGGGPSGPAGGMGPQAAAIALLERPAERGSLHRKQPLERLTPLTPRKAGPLATKRRGTVRDRQLLPEELVSQLAGKFPEFAKELQLPPSALISARISKAAQQTRSSWSEDSASLAEVELSEFKVPKEPLTVSQRLFRSVGGRLASAAYESQADRTLAALMTDPEIGIPLGVIAAFVETVVNDPIKTSITRVTEGLIGRWFSGEKLSAAAMETRREIAGMIDRARGSPPGKSLAKVRGQLQALRLRWQEGKDDIPEKVREAALQIADDRWVGFTAIWRESASGFGGSTNSAALVDLVDMQRTYDALTLADRQERLNALEMVWLSPYPLSQTARLAAMLRSAAILGLNSTDLERSAASEFPTMISRDGFGFPDASRLADHALAGVEDSQSLQQELANALRQKRREIYSDPATYAAFVRAARRNSFDEAKRDFVTSIRSSCIFEGKIVTKIIRNGITTETARPLTVNCF